MTIAKEFHSNFTAGEVSDLIGCRPDLAKYQNALSIAENINIYPEGGAYRSVGTKLNAETLFSNKRSRLIPFEFNAQQAYQLEVGDGYSKIWKADGTFLGQIATPWTEGQLPDVHYRQSADVLFLTHPDHEPRKISRISETNWSVTPFGANPPPTFEADSNVSGAEDLTLAVMTGSGAATTVNPVFLEGDVGRQIKFGASLATISVFHATNHVDVVITAPFSQLVLPAGQWFLTGSPNATLDPTNVGPAGRAVSLTASVNSFRAADVGKYVRIYDGVIKLYEITNPTTALGTIITQLSGWDGTPADNPAAAVAGAWTLEDASWSITYGWPRTLEFHQGRLWFAGTYQQPTTFWGSAVDDFPNFAKGPKADDAVEYTIAARKVNVIQWLLSLGNLFIGDAQNEHTAKGQGVDAPIGGDVIPSVSDASAVGSMAVQPVVAYSNIIFPNRFKNKMHALSYSLEKDSFQPINRTLLARQIGLDGFSQHPPAYAQEPDGIIYFILENGQLACLTYNETEDVVAWTRIVTDGFFESVSAIPGIRGHRVWVIVRRVINGQTKRFIEIFEPDDPNWILGQRAFPDTMPWTALQTHCAVTGVLPNSTTLISGLGHLEGKAVDCVVNDTYVGRFTVVGGKINIPLAYETNKIYEVGLPYTSTLRTLRPAVQQANLDGHTRQVVQTAIRIKNTVGGKVNGRYVAPANTGRPYSGLLFANPQETDYDGFQTLTQTEPYPWTVLSITTAVNYADKLG